MSVRAATSSPDVIAGVPRVEPTAFATVFAWVCMTFLLESMRGASIVPRVTQGIRRGELDEGLASASVPRQPAAGKGVRPARIQRLAGVGPGPGFEDGPEARQHEVGGLERAIDRDPE